MIAPRSQRNRQCDDKPVLAGTYVNRGMSAKPYVTRGILPGMLLAAAGHAAIVDAAEVGVRVSALQAATNLQGPGVVTRWPLSQGYFVQASLDRWQYERDRGLQPMPPGDLQNLVAGTAIGREFRSGAGVRTWFWTWGIAAGFPSASRNSGGQADRQFSSATEIHVAGALGTSQQLTDRWSLSVIARLERHFVDWRVTDGAGTLLARRNTLTASGLSLSVNYQF